MAIARVPLFIFLGLTALLAACAGPGTRVVLLPQPDGRPSAVVVRAHGGEKTLTQPYQRATALVGASGAPTVDKADPAEVKARNKSLFELAPPRAERYTLYFEGTGTVLTTASQKTFTDLLADAQARSGADLVVTGHTDTLGASPQNDDLSLRRAEQVKQLLIEQKFPPERIEAVGRGERELAVTTPDNTEEPRNRRVTVDVR